MRALSVGIVEIDVSIHAPAKEATSSCLDWADSLEVSIHAPAKEATRGRPVR